MWAIIEALIFDQTQQILNVLAPPTGGKGDLNVLKYPIEHRLKDWSALPAHCQAGVNRVQVTTGKNEGAFQELRISPTNKLWKTPDLAIHGDVANGGALFDWEAHVRSARIPEFPSYLRICLPIAKNAVFPESARYYASHLLDAVTENNVIGHGFTSATPDPELTGYDLIGEVMSHSWTEEWRTAWLRPRPLLFGPTESVETAVRTLPCDAFYAGRAGLAVICKRADEKEKVRPDLFLADRLQRDFPPSSSIALGEHWIDGMPLYTKARFEELIALRLIRPNPPQHVIVPVLDQRFTTLAGYSLSSVIALDIHERGAARMFSLLAEGGNAELSKPEWRDLHVNAWKRALGLRQNVIVYLCDLYFGLE